MSERPPAITRLERDLDERMERDLGAEPATEAIAVWVAKLFARIDALSKMEGDFEARYNAAHDEDARRVAIISLAQELGASQRQLAGDFKAFSRFFDRDAVVERVRRRIGEEERAVVFGLEQLGRSWDGALANGAAQAAIEQAWSYARDPRLREAGFRCLRLMFERNPAGEINAELLWEVQRSAIQPSETVWIQCEALTILISAAPTAAVETMRRRLAERHPADDFFVRRHVVRLIAQYPIFEPDRAELFALAARDPSPAVRQTLADQLSNGGPAAATVVQLLASDPAPKVRATILARCPEVVQVLGMAQTLRLLREVITRDQDDFVLRTALHVAADWASRCDPGLSSAIQEALEPAIAELRAKPDVEIKVRGWAAAAAERIWCASDPAARALATNITAALAAVGESQTVRVAGLVDEAERNGERVGRVLAVLAQDDFGIELLPSGKLRRGELIAFRTWRAIHEWRNPSSDKRQAFAHWTGRIWRGRTIAPSGIIAELAPTKVPGEPLFQPSAGDWRPWLPLPDMVLSAIDTGGQVRLYSAEGITTIQSPSRFLDRLRARMRLSWRFSDIAALRNWNEDSGRPSASYAEALRALGVNLSLRPHPGRETSAHVQRFFSVAPVALLPMPIIWERAQFYFSSLYSNDLPQLALFLLFAGGWFFINHLMRNRAMRRARDGLPLVIGGWGTRGKSGTERLKAAVVSALGHPLISKTTGNEAMFLHSAPFGEVREMFLFRPYDKATIWEQLELVVLAHELRAKVFLWECMGLTPSYVKVLQRHWTRDDIATITNTYPDHEDVQGPAGRNIPEVMTNFIPERSILITSEEQMRPILAQSARELETRFSSVGWLEAGLIPDEFLARFPYEEHPYNIALVTAVAAELGVKPDVSAKEMADRVVQDIGALKIYPEANVRSRRLEFVLGNSANERFGALGNWSRLGFDKHDPVTEPGLWITTVVNNRADRVPRSRVFASILVKDISADRHVLIGSNLEGLRGFIAEAWEEFAPSLTLAPPEKVEANPIEVLESLAVRFRIVHCDDQLRGTLAAMMRAQPGGEEMVAKLQLAEVESLAGLVGDSGLAEASAIGSHAERCVKQLKEYRLLKKAIEEADGLEKKDSVLRNQLWAWFREKIVVVDDYYATGEEIVRLLAEITPPGIRNRIMGMQNIKGTGLDFVYRWHAWETVHGACDDALSDQPARAQKGLQTLAAFREYGVLSGEKVRAVVQQLRSTNTASDEITQSQLDAVSAQLEGQLAKLDEASSLQTTTSRGGWWIPWLEAFLDAGDAVRRRKRANAVYRELALERISSERAVAELKRLTIRQKGGWLQKDLTARRGS